MTDREFERYCAKVLKRKGFRIVGMTKASHDQGADIIAKRFGKKYAIQCKLYSHPVGNHAIQEVYAGKRYYGCQKAMVMTNATFTKPAKDLARKTRVILIDNVSLHEKRRAAFSAITVLGFVLLWATAIKMASGFLSFP